MERPINNLILALVIVGPLILCNAVPIEREYKIEAFQKNGDSQTLILRLKPVKRSGPASQNRQGRQDEEEETSGGGSGSNSGSSSGSGSSGSSFASSSAPYYIPAVIPALTQIFTGIITGNLNEIVHGSTSFAPQNISYAIDTVYNQVVGLPAPVSTPATSRRPLFSALYPQAATDPPATEPPTPAPAAETEAPIAATVAPGQPLNSESIIITTPTSVTTSNKPNSNEDDEDESDVDGFGFRRLRRRDGSIRRS